MAWHDARIGARRALVERIMSVLWVILITGAAMLVYVIVLLRASLRGRQWAIDTIRAMACVNEGPAGLVWFDRAGGSERVEPEARLVA
jgi:hypothetical protein